MDYVCRPLHLTLLAPKLTEQKAIANLLQAADTEISSYQNQLAALKQQKTGLMQQLLTGKRRVQLEKDVEIVSI